MYPGRPTYIKGETLIYNQRWAIELGIKEDINESHKNKENIPTTKLENKSPRSLGRQKVQKKALLWKSQTNIHSIF